MNQLAPAEIDKWLLRSRTLREQLDSSDTITATDCSATFRRLFGQQLGDIRAHLEHHLRTRPLQSAPPSARTTITDVAELLAELSPDSSSQTVNMSLRHIPFVDALMVFVEPTMNRLKKRLHGRLGSPLSPSFKLSLRQDLAEQLSQTSAKCLYVELHEFRERHGDCGVYDKFIAQLRSDGLTSVFSRYPVLGRRFGAICMTWIDSMTRMILRFESDRPLLQGSLLGNVPEAGVSIQNVHAAGDRHHGERVSILTMSNGQRVVYKPRSLDLDGQWNRLLQHIDVSRDTDQPMFKTATILDRGEYGWQEHLKFETCSSWTEATLCFERFGSLLAMMHIMRCIDASCDNVIIHGGYPVLIDAETVLHPSLSPNGLGEDRSPENRIDDRFLESVIRTGAIPNSFLVDGKSVRDHSALGFTKPLELGPRREFVHVNSDQMALQSAEYASQPGHNVVRVGTETLSPADYQDAICRGVVAACSRIRSQRTWLLSADGIRGMFAGTKSRVLFRDTETYARTLGNATNPGNLTSGIAQSLVFEPLSMPFLLGGGLLSKADLMASEQRQLEAGDVPVFATTSSDCHLREGDRVIVEEMFEENALDAACDRIANLTPDEVDYQLRVIHGSLAAADNKYQILPDWADGASSETASHLDTSSIRATGLRIIKHVATTAILSESGSANFLCVQPHPGGRASRFGLLNESLYDGRLGVALVVSMYLREDPSLGQLVDGLVRDVETTLATDWSREAFCLSEKSAGHVGLGGILYCLLRIGTLTGRHELVELVLKACATINAKRARASRDLDLFGGTAGLLLAMLTIYRETKEPAVLAMLRPLSEPLLEAIENCDRRGLAHGSDGMGFVLLRLGQELADKRLIQVGLATRTVDCLSTGRLAGDQKSPLPLDGSVCNGLAGMAIAEIVDDDAERRSEARNTTRELCAAPYGDLTLCCGQAGICDAAIMHGNVSDAVDLAHRLHELAVVGLRVCDQWPQNGDVGVFKGLSGLAYLMARATSPETPCILTFE